MEYTFVLSIRSVFFDGNKEYVCSNDGSKSIRSAVIDFLDRRGIERTHCSVVFYNLEEQLLKYSVVEFINSESYEDFLDIPINELVHLFKFAQLSLEIGIGGIGGEVAERDGIHYYIYSRDEHLPKHVHCIKQNKKCKCYFDPIRIDPAKNNHSAFTPKEEKTIRRFVEKNMDLLLEKWHKLNPDLM